MPPWNKCLDIKRAEYERRPNHGSRELVRWYCRRDPNGIETKAKNGERSSVFVLFCMVWGHLRSDHTRSEFLNKKWTLYSLFCYLFIRALSSDHRRRSISTRTWCAQLDTINLSACGLITDIGVSVLGHGCGQLYTISLKGCGQHLDVNVMLTRTNFWLYLWVDM